MPLTKYQLECIAAAQEMIDREPARHFTIMEIAKKVGLSKTVLKNGFKEVVGMGPYQYRVEQRLEKGKSYLEETDKTLKEISRLLGYGYTGNFISAFKKKFGQSPAAWKKEL